MHINLPGELVIRVDAAAKQLADMDPLARTWTRTDTIKALLSAGLAALERGDLKP